MPVSHCVLPLPSAIFDFKKALEIQPSDDLQSDLRRLQDKLGKVAIADQALE